MGKLSYRFIFAAAAGFFAGVSHAHVAAYAKGMYCEGGNDTANYQENNRDVVEPLYQLPVSGWWMHAYNGCDKVPPRDNASLALPAGGKFMVELVHNQGLSTLSFGGKHASEWPDGQSHPEDWHGPGSPPGCLTDDGAMHTQNQSMAAGTAFAISYQSDIEKVTMENLVVFSVLANTPWHREAWYDVPKDLPPCPAGGCHCAWLWVPNGCGQPNEYMAPYKCNVTNSTSTKKVAPAQIPVYCKTDPSKCVSGAKQMIVFNQAEGNNVFLPAFTSPGYNTGMGWAPGAQNDIFLPASAGTPPSNDVSAPGAPTPAVTSTTTSIVAAATCPPVSTRTVTVYA